MVNINREIKRELASHRRTKGTIKATPLSQSMGEGRLRTLAYCRLLVATIEPDCTCEQCEDRRSNIAEMLGWMGY